MSKYVGADWASKGWATAVLEDGELSTEFHPTVWNLWHKHDDADQILVDIPIGLSEKGRRKCDEEAKDFLENRKSSVFWTPIRKAVEAENIEDAKNTQKEVMDYSISNQSWAIVPRIREVDLFLRENWSSVGRIVRESHPEICFWALNDHTPLRSKSSKGGLEARKNLLFEEPEIPNNEYDTIIAPCTTPDYARFAAENDVLDSIVLAVTAKRAANGNAQTLPNEPPEDEDELPLTDTEGLPMEIVYPNSTPDSRNP